MAIKNYIVKNKKKSTYIFLAFVICMVSIFAIVNANKTNAGVFITDDKGNKVQINEIKILEIVAREGEQVLGYTVDGQEPISVSQIESYEGPMNLDVDDFKAVTGYVVEKTQLSNGNYKYKVKESVLNHTFNDNVLGSSMSVGEIKVNAIQAGEVKVSDVEWADLIYINSNDYNENLLYYYDQFVNNGASAIQPGKYGQSFTDSYIKNVDKTFAVISKIISASGNSKKAAELTSDDFEFVQYALKGEDKNFDNFKIYNTEFYKAELAKQADNAFSDNIDDAIGQINDFFADCNATAKTTAMETIKSAAGNRTLNNDETLKANVINAFKQAELAGYIEVNDEAYILKLMTYRTGISNTGIANMITNVNGEQAAKAHQVLAGYKASSKTPEVTEPESTEPESESTEPESTEPESTEPESTEPESESTEPGGSDSGTVALTEEEKAEIIQALKEVNLGEIHDELNELKNSYINAFLSDDCVYSGSEDSAALQAVILKVNDEGRELARQLMADATIHSSAQTKFVRNSSVYYELAQLTGYNKFYIDEYTTALIDKAGTGDLLTDEKYDLTKLEAFIADVNNSVNMTEDMTVSCDISWKVANEIINRVNSENVALMYNTELLTGSHKIGDYTQDLSAYVTEDSEENGSGVSADTGVIDNTNNVYKLLLVTRQLRDTYYTQNLASKIDEEGLYYPNGIDSGEAGIISWYKDTFGTDFTLADGSVNVAKYHEPEVVGATYDETGTAGNSVNYVYKRIYSFTGEQFFGGKLFTTMEQIDMDSFVGVITAGTGYYDGSESRIANTESKLDIVDDSDIIFLDASSRSWTTAWAYFWDKNNTALGRFQMKQVDKNDSSMANKFYICVPEGAYGVIFTPQNSWNQKTSDIILPQGNIDGTQYKLNGIRCSIISKTSDQAISAVFLTNSIYYSNNTNTVPGDSTSQRVLYYGDLNLTLKSYNAKDINWRIVSNGAVANRDFQPIGDGDSITLGDAAHMDSSNRTAIQVQYHHTVNNNQINKVFHYKRAGENDFISITNFIDNEVVEFCKSMDMEVSFSGVSNISYTVSDNPHIVNRVTANGQKITFQFAADETKKDVTFTYTMGGQTKTVKTTIYQRDPKKVQFNLNYLSDNTATNASALTYDNTLSAADNSAIVGGNKGAVIRYILGVSINEAVYPIKVLEIQPAAAVNVYDSYAGAVKLAQYFKVDAVADGMTSKNYKDYFDVTYMSVKEFNTRNEDLTATYDLIYFGIDSGYQVVDSNGRTKYNDTSMNGLVYTGIGDEYVVFPFLRGTAAEDYVQGSINSSAAGHQKDYEIWQKYFTGGFTGNYWTGHTMTTNVISSWNITDYSRPWLMKNTYTTTRLGGNDITVKRMEDLLEYLKSGYPILLEDEIMNCDNNDLYIDHDDDVSAPAQWRYVDKNSKMYHFILEAKKLGYDSNTGTYSDSSAFYDGKTYASLVSVSNARSGGNPEYLSTEEKFNGGLSFAYKRSSKLEFEYVSGPQEYGKDRYGHDISQGNTGTTIGTTESDYKRYTIILDIKKAGGVTEEELANYDYRGYIDKSGVGKFEETDSIDLECKHEYLYNEDGMITQVKITGNWPGAMEGFIPWRIEVFNKNNEESKFSYTGYSSFETADSGIKDVYVLWIRPSNGLTLNFKNVLEDNDNAEGIIANYKIHLMTMTYAQFVSAYSSQSAYINDVNKMYDASTSLLKVKYMYDRSDKNQLYNISNMTGPVDEKGNPISPDKSLDMIVVGFSDSRGEMEINNIAALKDIEYFLNAGHSLLFSHDNAGFTSSINYYIDANNNRASGSSSDWARYTTSYLRKMLGMDQFGITYGGSVDSLPDEYKNARMYIDSTKAQDYRGIAEMCTFHYSSSRNEDANWAGASVLGNRLYSASLHGTTAQISINNWCHTRQVMRVNEGQITNYPFIIGEYLKTGTTHSQYNTLNLEDADTTIWYVLDNDGTQKHINSDFAYPEFYTYTKGDGTNNFYIYSKGNITYTGAGHKNDITKNEQKLFINTVIAALKAGNYEPEVSIDNAYVTGASKDKCINYYEDSNGVAVTFTPIDYDMKQNTLAFTDCKIYVDLDKDGQYSDKDILLNNDVDENGPTIMHNTNGTEYINFYGPSLLNRISNTFYFTNDDISTINGLIQGKGYTGTIFDYMITIQVSDKGYLKSKNPTPATASDSFKLVSKKTAALYNLD